MTYCCRAKHIKICQKDVIILQREISFDLSMKHENESKITAINWNPNGSKEILCADDQVSYVVALCSLVYLACFAVFIFSTVNRKNRKNKTY